MPKISVIVPVYNVENYLHRCIDSILTQTFTDFELILVDDGSTDNSGRICDEYKIADNRVIVIHKENEGPGPARNTGIEYALNKSDSEWIMFVDSDDNIDSRCIESLYKSILSSHTKISVCNYLEYNDFDNVVQTTHLEKFDVYNVEEFYCTYFKDGPWGTLIAKDLFLNIRFPNGKRVIGEDAYVMYKVFFSCKDITYVPTPLYFYYQSPNSLMRSEWSPNKMLAISAYEKQIDFFEKNHYYKALKRSVIKYAHSVYENIIECQKNDSYKVELKQLKS